MIVSLLKQRDVNDAQWQNSLFAHINSLNLIDNYSEKSRLLKMVLDYLSNEDLTMLASVFNKNLTPQMQQFSLLIKLASLIRTTDLPEIQNKISSTFADNKPDEICQQFFDYAIRNSKQLIDLQIERKLTSTINPLTQTADCTAPQPQPPEKTESSMTKRARIHVHEALDFDELDLCCAEQNTENVATQIEQLQQQRAAAQQQEQKKSTIITLVYNEYFSMLKSLIETTKWQTYGFGKLTAVNGNNIKLPHRVAEIYKICNNPGAEQELLESSRKKILTLAREALDQYKFLRHKTTKELYSKLTVNHQVLLGSHHKYG